MLEKNEDHLKIKLRFTNKSKLLKYIQNINVYYDESLKLAQCENQDDNFKFFCIEHITNNDSSFSYIVGPESIKEYTLSFDSKIELDYTKNLIYGLTIKLICINLILIPIRGRKYAKKSP